MDNQAMGNAVLMPQFYGLASKKATKKKVSETTEESQASVEVRKMNFKSTYDDFSQSSIITRQIAHSFVEKVDPNIPQVGQMYLNTQESLQNTKNEESGHFQTPVKTSNLQQVYQRESNASDPFHESINGSLINSVMQIQDSELERRQSRQKCEILMDMGEQQFKEGSYNKSLHHLEEVLKESQASFPEDISQKAKVYSMLGSNCLRMSIYDKSADYYLKALSLLSMDKQKNLKKLSDVHLTLGTIYQRTNYIDEAVNHYEQAYRLKAEYMPKLSYDFLMPLMNIAQLQCKKGNHMKAIQRYCECLAVNKSVYGDQHVLVAKNYYLMSVSLFEIKEFSMWLEYHYEALRMMKALKEETHPDYKLYLSSFPQKLRALIGIQNYAKDVVERSIHMANLLLNEDEQIQFLEKIKGDLQSSLVKE